ncbi:hypothetical protein ACJJTC_016557 [Scirpophaga incertulas]
MDPQPSTSSESSLSPKKKRPRIALSATEKLMVHNVYKHVYKNKSTTLLPTETPVKKECVSETADMLGISISTVYSVLEQRKENEQFKPPVKSVVRRGMKIPYRTTGGTTWWYDEECGVMRMT